MIVRQAEDKDIPGLARIAQDVYKETFDAEMKDEDLKVSLESSSKCVFRHGISLIG